MPSFPEGFNAEEMLFRPSTGSSFVLIPLAATDTENRKTRMIEVKVLAMMIC